MPNKSLEDLLRYDDTLTSQGSPQLAHAARVALSSDKPMIKVLNALCFAAEKHSGQLRKGPQGSPYINHPLAVTRLLAAEALEQNGDILAAAALHDTVEDTATSFEELEDKFGRVVAGLVRELTDDKNLPKAERKRLQIEHAAKASHGAKAVKLADKICNLRDLHAAPPADWPLERRREYFDWAKQVVDEMRGSHAVLDSLFDEAYAKRP